MSFTFSLSIASFFRDGTHGEAVSPIDVVPEPIAGIDVQAATEVGAEGRGRPIVAVRTHTAQGTRTADTITGSRKEQVISSRV